MVLGHRHATAYLQQEPVNHTLSLEHRWLSNTDYAQTLKYIEAIYVLMTLVKVLKYAVWYQG